MIHVVLPAYNEGRNIGQLIEALHVALADDRYRVIVVNDGSTDDTRSVVEGRVNGNNLKLVNQSMNMGLAAAVRKGFDEALSGCVDDDVIVVMDADNTQSPASIGDMVTLISDGADLVIASRYVPGAQVTGVPPLRRLLSLGASVLFRSLRPIPGVKDYTCGYRAYRASLLKAAQARYGGDFIDQQTFACMANILLRLRACQPKAQEVPLTLRYELKVGPSKMKVAKTITETLKLLLRPN